MKISFKIFMLGIFCAFISCSDNSTIPADNIEWTYGNTKTYQVSSSKNFEMTDTVTGYKFLFPQGGSGALTIKEITSGPDPSIKPIKKFSVSYTGNDTVYISIPHVKGDYDYLCVYSEITGASLTNIPTEQKTWHSISNFIETESEIKYIIPPDIIKSAKKNDNHPLTLPQGNFAFVKIEKNSSRTQVIELVKQTVKQDVDYIATFLSETDRQSYNNRYNLMTFSWSYSADADGSYFAFRNGYFGIYGDFGFSYEPGMGTPAIHHEAGHLINYLLYGTANYESLWARFGNVEHVAFTLMKKGRDQGLQEDIAYINENYIANVNSLGADLTAETNSMWNRITGDPSSPPAYNPNPKYIDFPALEGIAAAVIHQLSATNTKMYTFNCVNMSTANQRKEIIKSPTLGISQSDIYKNIMMKFPQTINDLMKFITDYLSVQSPDLLPKFLVRAEAIGWSYNGKVQLVDETGKPIVGAEVLPVMQTGQSTRDFSTITSLKSDAQGICYIPRIYPGSCILRVFYNDYKDSADFTSSIDYKKPTNVTIDYGKLTISQNIQEIPFSYEKTISFYPYNSGSTEAKLNFQFSISGTAKAKGIKLDSAITQPRGQYEGYNIPYTMLYFTNTGTKLTEFKGTFSSSISPHSVTYIVGKRTMEYTYKRTYYSSGNVDLIGNNFQKSGGDVYIKMIHVFEYTDTIDGSTMKDSTEFFTNVLLYDNHR